MKHNPAKVKVDEEANIVYVAMTRAQNRLIMPEAATNLPVNWLSREVATRFASSKRQQRIEHSSAARSALPSVSKRNVRRASRDALGVNGADTYSVGDRVLTSNGLGRIVEKRSEKEYLIELDDYPCKMCLSPHMFKNA